MNLKKYCRRFGIFPIFLFIFLFSHTLFANISINAVGDIMMGTLYPRSILPPDDGKTLFKFTEHYLRYGNPDFIFGNLEGAITDYNHTNKNIESGRAFAFEMPPRYAGYLKNAGFNIVSTANNHARDFGTQGYEDTRRYLRQNGISAVGTRDEIKYFNVRGVKVAWIGFSWFSYSNNILDLRHSKEIIRKAADSSDIVIVSVHAGAEGDSALHIKNKNEYFYGENRGNLMKFAHLAVDNGADLVLGHSPHVPRAMELYKGRLIAYSLGNFLTYRVFSTTGYKRLVPILHIEMSNKGKFLRGRIISCVQISYGRRKGIPVYDSSMKVIKVIKMLSNNDIKNNEITISDSGFINIKYDSINVLSDSSKSFDVNSIFQEEK